MTTQEHRTEYRKDTYLLFAYKSLNTAELKLAEKEYGDKNHRTPVVFPSISKQQMPCHVNISASGITLCIPRQENVGDHIALAIKLHQDAPTMHIICQVVESNEGLSKQTYFMRIHFTHISEANKEAIRELVFQ